MHVFACLLTLWIADELGLCPLLQKKQGMFKALAVLTLLDQLLLILHIDCTCGGIINLCATMESLHKMHILTSQGLSCVTLVKELNIRSTSALLIESV